MVTSDLASRITVYLHTTLQRQTSEGLQDRLELSLPPGSTLADLLQHLAIDSPEEYLLLVVNGRLAELSQPLQSGDQVHLMPAISGG